MRQRTKRRKEETRYEIKKEDTDSQVLLKFTLSRFRKGFSDYYDIIGEDGTRRIRHHPIHDKRRLKRIANRIRNYYKKQQDEEIEQKRRNATTNDETGCDAMGQDETSDAMVQ